MQRFARVADAAAALPGKLEKVASIADYLRSLDDANLEAATRFFTGSPFAARDQRSLNAGGRTVVAVAQRLWGFDDRVLSERYRETGDLGAALGPLVRQPGDLTLFASEPLTPALLEAQFVAMADAEGRRAGKRREQILEQILRACTDPLEATYVIKIITGELRIGLREGLIHDAIAAAFGSTYRDVHRAAMASGDIGATAIAARCGSLDEMHVAYGAPIGFMLASPIPYGDEYRDLDGDTWISEAKFDGIRVQAHVYDGTVRLYSRNLNDVTRSYPEIAGALRAQPRRMVLDGEIVASRDGKVLPFRMLQARLARKEIDAELLAEVPLAYAVFDLIALDDEFLIDEPLQSRKTQLAQALLPSDRVRVVVFEALGADAPGSEVNRRFERARADGHEGLMLKRIDAPYNPGKRGRLWLKLKRELTTLDVVVVAVEWGHGKRAKVLSDYTFAVDDGSGNLVTIGKAYSGLTDAEIAALTPWFLEHRLPPEARREKGRRGEIPVEPKVVLEVAFDIVQKSDLHKSGFSLRFPRIVRIRDDKPAAQADTIERVREIYGEMLAREGLS